MLLRRFVALAVAAGLAIVAGVGAAQETTGAAQETDFFRIATGGIWGTYYPIGSLVASAISNPPGSRPCEEGGSCGVPGLIAVSQAANGSVANVEAIASGTVESGFAQSDVAYWAYTGTGTFEGKNRIEGLRAATAAFLAWARSVRAVSHFRAATPTSFLCSEIGTSPCPEQVEICHVAETVRRLGGRCWLGHSRRRRRRARDDRRRAGDGFLPYCHGWNLGHGGKVRDRCAYE